MIAVAISRVLAAVTRGAGIETKPGVAWKGPNGEPTKLELVAGLYRAQWAVLAAGLGPFVVTSLYDSTEHLPNSYHYKGLAADIRTRHLDAAGIDRMWHVIASALGPGWDVIFESDHIHIEYDPRDANVSYAHLGVRT
jgi:hypothetical protein